MSREAGVGDQGDATSPESKPTAVKANGSAPVIPWVDPGGPSPSGSQRPRAVKSSPEAQAKSQAKPEQIQKSPEEDSKGTKEMAERNSQEKGAKEKEGGKFKSAASTPEPQKGLKSSKRKSPSDAPPSSKPQSISGILDPKVKDTNAKHGASQKALELKGRSPTSDISVPSKSQTASLVGDVKDSAKKDDAGDTQKKAQDTSKRKSPIVETKTPMKAETSHRPLARKAKETESKSAAVTTVNQPVGTTKRKSPTGERSASSAILRDSDRNGKANVGEASTSKVDEKSIEEKSPNGERSVAPKPESITGSKSSTVVGSAAGNAQETSKRKSPTDEKSIPSAKMSVSEEVLGRKTKDSEKKDPLISTVSKAQDNTKIKSTGGEISTSSKSVSLTGDKSAMKAEKSGKESVGTQIHKTRDVSTKVKALDLDKVTASKSAEVSKDISQSDKDKGINGTPKELEQGPARISSSIEKATFSKDHKLASEITDQSSKSSSPVSRAKQVVEKRSAIEKPSSQSLSADDSVSTTSKFKSDTVDSEGKKSSPVEHPSELVDAPAKDTKAETLTLETPDVRPDSKQKALSSSDIVAAKDKQVKTVTPVTKDAPKDLGSSCIPKEGYDKSSEVERVPEGLTSPSGIQKDGALLQKEDHSKAKASNSKKPELEVASVELSDKKDSKLPITKTADAKTSNGNGVVASEYRQKPQNGVELKTKSHGSLARERSLNGKKSATSSADPNRRGKNGESKGEGRPSVQKVNGGQATNPPSSSVRVEGLNSPASSVTPNGSSSRTPTEHKTIVQKLQEARQEAILVRGTDRRDLRQQYSKSEMVLPAAVQTTIPVASGDASDKQVTSSPNIKVQTPTTHVPVPPSTIITQVAPTAASGGRPKEMSRSEAVLPAAERTKEKQRTSSPNLSAPGARQAGSAEGLPKNSFTGRNGHSEAPAREPSSRKGSVISDTATEGMPGDVTSRARSATWSQAAPQQNRRRDEAGEDEDDESSTAPASAASEDPEWDKRWSSAGSDVLAHKGHKASRAAPGVKAFGKEWRSEWGSETAWRGVAPTPGRVWESEAGLLGRHQRGPPPPGRLDLGAPGPLARKELVSPSSSSTASKGSGIERISEASSSYHSATSSTHGQRRDSVRVEQQPKDVVPAAAEEEAAVVEDSGDRVKLIEGAVDGHHHLQMERKSGSGRRRGGHGNGHGNGSGNGGGVGGVENRGADLERVLQEEEEAAGEASRRAELAAGPADQRSFIDIWDSEDKFSVANSQLPLTPAGGEEEDERGSIGSVATAEPERGNWTGRFDFLLSLLGYSVGLGNVWRFPYLCYNNGGGAFLIPFTIMLVIAGLPLMFMELSFGQFASLGPAAIYAKFCPLFHGLGFGMVIVSTVVMLYYNLIIAWTIFYMFASLNKQLPWQNCEPEWSTLDCYSYEIADKCAEENGTYYQRTCYNETESAANNITQLAEVAEKRPPAEEYFNNYVLGLSKGIEETGEVRLSMALCLLLAWAIVFLCLSKGVQSSGKVVYFTALFPYVVLIILFIRGVTLPGASTGILFYLTPDWKRLSNAQVWGDAAVQIFFALSPAWGGLITLASYNKFSNNCYKDSLIVAVSNILTSFFAGFVIFSVIGFLAHELNVEVKKVVDQGAGLAFIVYPEVVTRLPVSPVWSLLFFVMLLTLGLDSQFALMETVTTAILDRFPNLREKKVWVVLVVAILGYFGGLIFTTNSGMYWLQLMDKYAANWSVLLIAISECILIAWVYGAGRFLRDVQEMIGPQSRLWMFFWCWMWKLVTPATLLFILFFNWVEYAPASYGEYIYPMWADAAGWVIGVLPVVVIIIVGIVKVCTAPEGALRDKLRKLLQPTPDWGPSLKRSSAPPTYDSLRNTIVLMNGLPVIQETHVESLEDNTL